MKPEPVQELPAALFELISRARADEVRRRSRRARRHWRELGLEPGRAYGLGRKA